MMDDNVTFWTCVVFLKVFYNTCLAKCMKTFCDGSSINKIAFAQAASDVSIN